VGLREGLPVRNAIRRIPRRGPWLVALMLVCACSSRATSGDDDQDDGPAADAGVDGLLDGADGRETIPDARDGSWDRIPPEAIDSPETPDVPELDGTVCTPPEMCDETCDGTRCDQLCREGSCDQDCTSEDCRQSCHSGMCEQTCVSAGDCSQICVGCCCDQTCVASDCSLTCLGGGGCSQTCAHSDNCSLICGAGCDLSCFGPGTCTLECVDCDTYCAGTACTVLCPDDCQAVCEADTCVVEQGTYYETRPSSVACGADSDCRVTCGSAVACDVQCLGTCAATCTRIPCTMICADGSAAAPCPDGTTWVCDRECP